MKRSPLLVLTVVALLLLAVIGIWAVKQQPKTGSAEIVVSSTPVRLIVEPIVGSSARITQLIPSGQELHDYQARPEDISALAEAKLIVRNGADLDTALIDELLALRSEETALEVLTLSEVLVGQGKALLSTEGEEHGTLETDPHLWVSPKNILLLIDPIRDALSAHDPLHAPEYKLNAERFRERILALDEEILTQVSQFSSRGFIGFHNAFGYFAQDYGLTQLAALESTPGEAPSPQDLVAIQELVETHQIRALFAEPQFDSQLVEQLARDLNLTVAELDPMETVEAGDDYVSVMQRNVAALGRALR